MGLGRSRVGRTMGTSGAETFEGGAEPVEEFPGADVVGLPPGVQKPTPHRGHEVLWVASPHGMADDVGHTVFEILHVGAGFHARNEAAHEDAAQLGPGCRGTELGVASDVERVILFPIEDGGAELVIVDAALDSEVDKGAGVT